MLFNSAAIVAILATAVSAAPAPQSNVQPSAGRKWAVTEFDRYCNEDNSGCDYNFSLTTDEGKTRRCNIGRSPGQDAPYENWSGELCQPNLDFFVSWGISGTGKDAFATLTITEGNDVAWWGVPNVNSRESETCGDDHFGDLGEEQVYTQQTRN